MMREIKSTALFLDRRDRDEFARRPAVVAQAGGDVNREVSEGLAAALAVRFWYA